MKQTECVILFRNTQNRSVGFMSAEDGENINVFKDYAAAEEFASGHFLLQHFPYQIVELDDL